MSINQIHLDTHTTNEIARDAPRPFPPDAGEAEGGFVWLDVSAPTEDDLAWLARAYGFHPLAIEDCRNFNQRAKVEAYHGYLFLSLTTTARKDGKLIPQEMEAFLGPDYLITVHREPLDAINQVREHWKTDVRPDFLLYLIADHMVDVYFPMLDEMEDEIDELEDAILENATQATMHRIFTLKQQLVLLRKITAPMRDVMNALAGTRWATTEGRPYIDAQTALYFRDAYDHLTRIYDLIETSRDLLGNALDAYLSTVSNRLNEVMKRLTLLTTVFMPISFLVGFGGMNFQQMPFDNPVAFAILISLLGVVPISMLIWFWRSKWV
jgi:magnesium transporter